jgi:Coenzyme PQQ synthesis protein D (PqqD)
MSELDKRYRLPGDVLRAVVDDDEVLLEPSSGRYHLVNRTGRAVLDRFDSGEPLEGAIEHLCSETGAPREQVEADVTRFIRAMVERGLLEEARA